jgi:hypothetical protein
MQGGINSLRAIVAGYVSLLQRVSNVASCQDCGLSLTFSHMWRAKKDALAARGNAAVINSGAGLLTFNTKAARQG